MRKLNFMILSSFLLLSFYCSREFKDFALMDTKGIEEQKVGAFIGSKMESVVLIKLYQHKSSERQLKIQIVAKYNRGIEKVLITSKSLKEPIEIKGKGKWWEDSIYWDTIDTEYLSTPLITIDEDNYKLPIELRVEVTCWRAVTSYSSGKKTFYNTQEFSRGNLKLISQNVTNSDSKN